MKVNWKTIIKCVWVTLCFFHLPLGLGTFLVAPASQFANDNLIPVLLLLSFPSGPIALLLGGLFIDASALDPPFRYSLVWLAVFVAGYLQWFVIIPGMFERPGSTMLGLAHFRQPVNVAVTLPVESPASTIDLITQRPVPYNDQGQTPLERVICDQFSNSGDSQMPAEEGRDLPSVNSLPGQLG